MGGAEIMLLQHMGVANFAKRQPRRLRAQGRRKRYAYQRRGEVEGMAADEAGTTVSIILVALPTR